MLCQQFGIVVFNLLDGRIQNNIMKKGLKRIVTTALAAVLMFVQLPMVESKAASQIELSG